MPPLSLLKKISSGNVDPTKLVKVIVENQYPKTVFF